MRKALSLAVIMGMGCGLGPAGVGSGPPPEADVSILFVGNSLTATNNLPGMLERLLTEHGQVGSVYTEAVVFGNFGLMDHWAVGTARDRIREGGWDYVVIQQGPSATEGRPSLLQYSAIFADEANAVGARLALYMVWPSTVRSFDFDGVSDSYRTAAVQTGSLLFPAGEAWRAAWAIDPDLPLYGPDGFHPSVSGTYLAALVMYEQISGRDPRSLPDEIPLGGGPLELPPDVADALHDGAAAANAEFALP
jgi:hypothetical protein